MGGRGSHPPRRAASGSGGHPGEDALPSYWSNKKSSTRFKQIFYLGQEDYAKFDDLLSSSYLPLCTQDRPCPNGTCEKTALGCRCNQPGGDPGLPTGYAAQCVMRVEDFHMWERYKERRKAIAAAWKDKDLQRLDIPALTDNIADKYPNLFQPLSDEINEVYLWYGKSVRAALSLVHDPLELDPATTSGSAAFSRRARCAESITQADECASGEKAGHYQDLFALLLCRVCMGKMYQTTVRDELACGRVAGSAAFDSTLGNQTPNTFREFIVYSAEQIYPEYVVLYRRLYKGQDAERVRQALPFYTELPLYWKNCFRDPHSDSFAVRYLVIDPGPKAFLQDVVRKSSKKKLTVVSVARVENSDVWREYMSSKAKLAARLRVAGGVDGSSFKSPAELDSKKNKGLTVRERLEDFNRAQVLSTEHFNSSLNELVLWHGTSFQKAASEKTDGDLFHVASGECYGKGIYLAEELDRCLSYAPQDYYKHQWVLLCRALCGDLQLVTSKHPDALTEAMSSGKDSVLARRQGRPREFLVSEHQLYPEYVLELALQR